MLLLVGRSVRLTTSGISSLAIILPVTDRSHPCDLLVVARLHLQPVGEGRGLPGAPEVVGGGKPDVDDLVFLVAVLVDHLVDGRVPVQRLVLLHVPSVARGVSQIRVGDLWPHSSIRSCTIKPDHIRASKEGTPKKSAPLP